MTRTGSALAAALAFSAAAFAWETGERAPEAPEELEQFGFLIGCFVVDAAGWDPEADDFGDPVEARWNGQWALEGWAIYDEWFDPPGADPETPVTRGGNLRIYDETARQWRMVWTHTVGRSQVLRAEQRDEGLVMWSEVPRRSTDWMSVFTTQGPDAWTRLSYTRPYGGDAWTPELSLQARRTDCPAA